MAEGRYTLIAELQLSEFDSAFSTFERGLKASLTGLERQFSQVFSGNAAKGLSGAYAPLTNELKGVQAEAKRTGDGLGAVGTGAADSKRSIDPLKDSIRGLSNELNNYKVRLEAGEIEQADFVRSMQGVITNSKTLRDTVDQTSTEYTRLTNIVGLPLERSSYEYAYAA